jgi:hypothetical protein
MQVRGREPIPDEPFLRYLFSIEPRFTRERQAYSIPSFLSLYRIARKVMPSLAAALVLL